MDPELLKALAGAGMTEEQLRMLGPQLQMGQQLMQPQMAQGSQVGTGPFQTYVAASPLEHLSNAVRQIIGAKITRGVMDKQQALLGQQREARQGAFQGLQTALSGGQGGTLGAPAGGTPYEQFAGATPNGGGATRSPDPQAAQALMTAMAGSGDQALQAGAHFGLQSQQLERQNSILQNTMRHQQTMEQLAAGRLENAQQNTGLKAKRWNPATQSFVDVRGPSAPPGATSAAGGGATDAETPPVGSPAYRALQQEQRQWRVMMDPTAKGSGDLHDQYTRISQANVLETLMTNEKGGLQNLTSQQQREAAISLARMLGAGGGMSEGGINELDAPSLKRWLAQKQQWLTSAPVGTEAYGIFQNILDTARREKEQAQSSIKSTMGKRLTNFPLMRKYQADSVRNVLEGYGLNYDKEFDPTGKYTGPTIGLTPEERGNAKASASGAAPPPPAGGAPGLSPKDAQAVQIARERLKKNPNDATALQVLKLNGAQ